MLTDGSCIGIDEPTTTAKDSRANTSSAGQRRKTAKMAKANNRVSKLQGGHRNLKKKRESRLSSRAKRKM